MSDYYRDMWGEKVFYHTRLEIAKAFLGDDWGTIIGQCMHRAQRKIWRVICTLTRLRNEYMKFGCDHKEEQDKLVQKLNILIQDKSIDYPEHIWR